jgi:hypothetical protein
MSETACRVCGRDDWNANTLTGQKAARAVHEAAHVRKGDARFTGTAARGEMRPIEVFSDRSIAHYEPSSKQQLMSAERIQVSDQEPDVSVPTINENNDAMKLLQQSLILVNLAMAVQRLHPEQAAQLVGTITSLGNNVKVRR